MLFNWHAVMVIDGEYHTIGHRHRQQQHEYYLDRLYHSWVQNHRRWDDHCHWPPLTMAMVNREVQRISKACVVDCMLYAVTTSCSRRRIDLPASSLHGHQMLSIAIVIAVDLPSPSMIVRHRRRWDSKHNPYQWTFPLRVNYSVMLQKSRGGGISGFIHIDTGEYYCR